QIHNLDIDQDHFPHIQARSIDLRLNNVSFASEDSLYLLTVKEFALYGNNLVCRNAFLQPSPKSHGYLSGVNIPSFTLIDVSLQDLLEKKLKAKSVLIERPELYFVGRIKTRKTIEKSIRVEQFYDVLNELGRMISVHWLTVEDGQLEYRSAISGKFKLS